MVIYAKARELSRSHAMRSNIMCAMGGGETCLDVGEEDEVLRNGKPRPPTIVNACGVKKMPAVFAGQSG